ncbi:thioesterase-like superfamily-domain-containing protein [Penicillium waksmanii]|uniref:thioesterase-like superfamily-domain-containing protein n=1 Tax=Penicillium waksmanii TaxID=69791 RepID=UPI0025497597|nr:thioesterase-like superfamily-domain-containing protein [Penicillium waksmanii]KAJ5982852.1 thioesterase-like superfamily-domain-containing protein [Penicillium waksmanii]
MHFSITLIPPTSAVRYYNPNDGENLMWSPKLGQNARDQWGKLDDDDMFHLEHLGLVADLIPAIHMNYQDSALEAVLHYDYPTVSMDLDFLKDPAGREEWLLMRTKMYKLQNGRFDMHVQIIDDDGDLVATAKQTCLVLKRSGLGDIGMRSRM